MGINVLSGGYYLAHNLLILVSKIEIVADKIEPSFILLVYQPSSSLDPLVPTLHRSMQCIAQRRAKHKMILLAIMPLALHAEYRPRTPEKIEITTSMPAPMLSSGQIC